MSELEDKKLKEEIKTIRVNRLFTLVKIAALTIGSIILFISIQRPESILNRKMSEEEIGRERVKLVLDILENDENEDRVLFNLSLIKSAYPNTQTEWIENVRNFFLTEQLREENLETLDSLSETEATIRGLRVTLDSLLTVAQEKQAALMGEVRGTGGTGRVGLGPVAGLIRAEIDTLYQRIERINIQISMEEANRLQMEDMISNSSD